MSATGRPMLLRIELAGDVWRFASLPAELLQHIVGLAAYPLSAWAPLQLPAVPTPLNVASLPAA